MTPLETLALVALVAAGFALIFALIVATTRRGADTPPAEDWDDWSRSEPDETDTARRPGRAGLLVLAALVLALPGCASMGGPRHVTAVSLAGTAGVLETFLHTEKQLVCGQPSAPQAPLCVTVPRHLQIMDMVERAAVLGSQASAVMASLPRGTPQPAQVVTMLAQVQGLVVAAMNLVPESKDKAALAQAIGFDGVK